MPSLTGKVRASGARNDDALGEVLREANALGETLHGQRLGALEAATLLRKVMAEIDVAVYAFDNDERLRLLNPQAERLLDQPAERLLGRRAADLHLAEFLKGDTTRIVDLDLPGGMGRWELRRARFHEGGLPHQLVVLSNLTRTLHEEERRAWRRLIQILRHEINNSLAPIHSLSGTLASLISHQPQPRDWQKDLRKGLEVIAERSEALNRFMTSYAQLTRLPKPQPGPVNVANWVQRVAGLETRMDVTVIVGPDVEIQADSDQLDQLLINLVRNAVDAVIETGGDVRIGWDLRRSHVELWVEDDGPGLPDTTNLFVPFFTTKPEGAGIGLALSRQIAEAHGGNLVLENRKGAAGSRARLRLSAAEQV